MDNGLKRGVQHEEQEGGMLMLNVEGARGERRGRNWRRQAGRVANSANTAREGGKGKGRDNWTVRIPLHRHDGRDPNTYTPHQLFLPRGRRQVPHGTRHTPGNRTAQWRSPSSRDPRPAVFRYMAHVDAVPSSAAIPVPSMPTTSLSSTLTPHLALSSPTRLHRPPFGD